MMRVCIAMYSSSLLVRLFLRRGFIQVFRSLRIALCADWSHRRSLVMQPARSSNESFQPAALFILRR